MDEERDDYNREEWGIAHNRYKLDPLYDPNALMKFMVENQGRKHNKIEE